MVFAGVLVWVGVGVWVMVGVDGVVGEGGAVDVLVGVGPGVSRQPVIPVRMRIRNKMHSSLAGNRVINSLSSSAPINPGV